MEVSFNLSPQPGALMRSAGELTQVTTGAGGTTTCFRHRTAAYRWFVVKNHSQSLSPARGDSAFRGQGYTR